MTTIPQSVATQLDGDWTGAGGAKPEFPVGEDYRTNPPLGENAVWISDDLQTDPRPVNDTFVDEYHTLTIKVNAVSADRLKELADEVVRILNATTIANVTYQRYKDRRNVSGVDFAGVFNYHEIIQYDLREHMKTAAAAYGGGATGDFVVVGDLDVGGDADITGDLELGGELIMDGAVLHGSGSDFHMHPSTGNIPMNLLLHPLGTEDESSIELRTSVSANYGELKLKIDGTTASLESNQGGGGTTPDTLNIDDAGWDAINIGDSSCVTKINSYDVGAALLLGTGNKAYVPMVVQGGFNHDFYGVYRGEMLNQGADDFFVDYILPIPHTKGSLSLYIDELKFGVTDADATDYVTTVELFGWNGNTATAIDSDPTNQQSAGDKTWSIGSMDVSSYQSLTITLVLISAVQFELGVGNMRMRCWYQ